MPCYTRISVEVEDTVWTRKARKALGLPAEGTLSNRNAKRVNREAAVLKTMGQVRALDPRAIIRRDKATDKLTITVQR